MRVVASQSLSNTFPERGKSFRNGGGKYVCHSRERWWQIRSERWWQYVCRSRSGGGNTFVVRGAVVGDTFVVRGLMCGCTTICRCGSTTIFENLVGSKGVLSSKLGKEACFYNVTGESRIDTEYEHRQ